MSQGETSRPTGDAREESEEIGATTTPNGQLEPTQEPQVRTTSPPTQTTQQPLPQPYRPPQVPYAPYPQPIPYAQPIRILPPYSKPWTLTKLVLAFLSFCWAIIILSLSLAFSFSRDGYGSSAFIALYTVPVQIVVIFWNLAELTTYFVRSRKGSDTRRGIHPGAHIGMHLVFWLACVFGILMALMSVISTTSSIEYCTEEADDDYYVGYHSGYCNHYSDISYLPGLRAAVAMWCLALITHFVLFILACIDTHRRNRLRPAGVVFAQPGAAPYIATAQGMVPLTYYPPPPQQVYFAGPAPVGGTPAPQTKQPIPQQNYQDFAGFYSPPAPEIPQVPSPGAPAPGQPTTQPAAIGSNGDEVTPAPPRT